MIDLALDPSDTRPARAGFAPVARAGRLRIALVALGSAAGLAAFGVAASTVMAALVAPPPRVSLAPPSRAAQWPDLKDGLPALADASKPAAPVEKPDEAKRAEPEAPALRMAALPDPRDAMPAPTRTATASPAPQPAAPEPPAKRIPVATPVTVIGPARQVAPLAPVRTTSLQQPRPSETVRAREVAEPTPAVTTPAAVTPPVARALPAEADAGPAHGSAVKPGSGAVSRSGAAEQGPNTPGASARTPEKTPRKAVAARKPAAPAAGQPTAQAPAVVASASAEPEETEVLGVKLPSLAPAGRKLKEGLDALGDAVKSVF